MDSQERHELKQNDLMEFFTHFNQWWKKNGTSTLLTIVLAVGAIFAIQWFRNKDARELNAAGTALAAAASGDSAEQVARNYQDVASRYAHIPGIYNLALLKAADIIRADVTYRDSSPQKTSDGSLTEIQRLQLDKAARLYKQIINGGHIQHQDGSQTTSIMVLNAHMGLANVYESLGEFDNAADQYALVQKEAGTFRTISQLAQTNAARIQQISQPVVFPQAPAITSAIQTETDVIPSETAEADLQAEAIDTNDAATSETDQTTEPATSTESQTNAAAE